MSYLPVKSALRSNFRLSTLALSVSLALMSSHGFALEALDDASLADSTGEGLAFLPENFGVVMQGTTYHDTNGNISSLNNPNQADLDNRANDTGYVRLIPVGPLTTESQDTNKDGVVNTSDQPVGKADIFLYGLAISQSGQSYGAARSSTDWNGRFGRNIDSWGSAVNPWVFKVATQKDVPNFSAISPTDTGKGDVSYLALEAPLYHADTDGNSADGVNAGIAGLSPAEQSAYNLKLGLWADIFVRDPKVAENLTSTGTQFDLGGAGRANRLRFQAVWDGFSLNGSNLKIFQTLGGATNTGGMSTFYNNTLGISGLLRLNSGDGQTLRASVSGTESKSRAEGAWTLLHDGSAANFATTSVAGSGASCNNGTQSAAPNYGATGCQYQVRQRAITDTSTAATWTPPSKSSVLRISTRETGNTGRLTTPAINAGVAPSFDPNEGLFLYNPNINLVLGSLYQPLTVGVAPDGKNITLEIARIPNKESIYKQVYTNYADINPATNGGYYGSTCNIYQCGAQANLDGTRYQGSNATHSSITIGSTVYNPTTNTLEAYKGIEAVGISFGAMNSYANTAKATYTELQQRQRQQATVGTWTYNCSSTFFGGSCGNSSTGTMYDWVYNNNGTYQTNDRQPLPANGTSSSNPGAVPSSAQFPTVTNRTWDASSATWMPAGSTAQNFVGIVPSTIPAAPIVNATPSSAANNFGSAVIDGLLIQHMKITTKGL